MCVCVNVGESHCNRALSFWVPSCLRLCVSVRFAWSVDEKKIMASEWAELFKISLQLRFLLGCYSLMCDVASPNVFFSLSLICCYYRCLLVVFVRLSVCSQQTFIIINNMPTFRVVFSMFFFAYFSLVSLFILNCLCVNIFGINIAFCYVDSIRFACSFFSICVYV